MKIQISPKRIIKDAAVVWHEHGPEVDIVMDLKNLTFRPGSVDEIYALHVLDHFFPDEVEKAVANWYSCLSTPGKLVVVVDDFEYLSRAFVAGDFTIDLFNDLHNHPTQFTRENIVEVLSKAGFPDANQVIWFDDIPEVLKKKHYELVVDAKKI